MKHFLSLTLLTTVLSVSFNANATIRRVGYFGTATAIDYTSLQSAHDAAAAGDSIYVYPGSWSANLSKQLVVLGYGYFLTGAGSNAGLQNITGALSVSVNLKTGSGNSVFESLDNFAITIPSGNVVNNVFVNRCHGNISLSDQAITGWHITQSFISGGNGIGSGSYYPAGSFSGFEINNCVIYQITFGGLNATSGQFNNDFFDNAKGAGFNFGNGNLLFFNCIFNGVLNNTVNATFNYCIGSQGGTGANGGGNYGATSLQTGNGNKTVDISTVYVGYTNNTGGYSSDGSYALSSGSAAKGAGAGGTDCGIFGGTAPYVLSGLPPLPVFYQITAPSTSTSTNPYTITISVKSNN
jgi:hypothetical protein